MKAIKYVALTGIICMLLAPWAYGKETVKGNVNDFLKYLEKNKKSLEYKGYTTSAQGEEVEVKVDCTAATQKKLLEVIDKFATLKYHLEMTSPDSILFFATFAKVVEEAAPAPEALPVAPQPQPCPKKMEVQAGKIVGETFLEYAYYEGKAQPAHDAEITAALAGTVVEVMTAVGADILQGQVIATLATEELEKEIQAAEKSVTDWETTLNRRRNWKERSPQAEKAAETKLEEARALLQAKKEQLANATIVSPLNGRVEAVMIEKGASILSGTLVAKVADISLIELQLPTDAAGRLSDGQEIAVTFKEIAGEFKGLVRKSDEKAAIVIENPENKIATGMTGQYRILVQEHPGAVVLPSEQILTDDTGSYVYIRSGKRAKKAYVVGGAAEQGRTLIVSGLMVGQEVLSGDPKCIKDGKKIKVVTTFTAPKPAKLPEAKKEKKEKFEAPGKQPYSLKSRFRIGVTVANFAIKDEMLGIFYKERKNLPGFDLSFNAIQNFELWASYKNYSDTSETSYLENPTELKITPLSVGIRYRIGKWSRFEPFVGIGADIYSYRETYEAGLPAPFNTEFKSNASGFFVQGGTYIEIVKLAFAQVFVKYNMVKDTGLTLPNNKTEFDLSGLEYGLGIGIRF